MSEHFVIWIIVIEHIQFYYFRSASSESYFYQSMCQLPSKHFSVYTHVLVQVLKLRLFYTSEIASRKPRMAGWSSSSSLSVLEMNCELHATDYRVNLKILSDSFCSCPFEMRPMMRFFCHLLLCLRLLRPLHFSVAIGTLIY